MDSNVTIRLAGTEDWQAIINIYNQGIDDGCNAFTRHISVETHRGWLEMHDGNGHALYVAESRGKVIGWISLSPYRKERLAFSKTAETSYYIDRQYRNRQIGSSLMAYVLKRARESGFHVLVAFLLDINLPSVALLEKYGFTRWGHLLAVADFEGRIVGQFIYGIHFTDVSGSR